MNALFIFRRDFRLFDNRALIEASKKCNNIYTIFIFTPEQVTEKNTFRSVQSIAYMINSLKELNNDLKSKNGKLFTFFGKNETILEECIKMWKINMVFWNKDYSPYAKKRDTDCMNMCKALNVDVTVCEDYYLNPPNTIFTGDGKSYLKYTPYMNKAIQSKIPFPHKNTISNFIGKNLRPRSNNLITLDQAYAEFIDEFSIISESKLPFVFKRKDALKILTRSNNLSDYHDSRNDLHTKTSRLSAPIKYGIVSIREVYHAFKNNDAFIKQLIWRDFYAQILDANPKVLGSSLKEHYNSIKWTGKHEHFVKWCQGKTGFPIVDAGMIELNTSGYMHNRARLITASFLVKTLLIDWQKGEKYFATKLIDYDPASNNGNWQWVASTGADSQPYFRIFNPWSQSENHDNDAVYIKKWIPQLKSVPAKDLHNWDERHTHYKDIDYPTPIVDYKKQKEKALKMYKSII